MIREVRGNKQLEVIAGCMFSGKTEELIIRLERAKIAGLDCLVFKPTTDTRRKPGTINTCNGREFSAHDLEPGAETAETISSIVGRTAFREADVIAFDEGQFFSEKLTALCEELVTMGKRVIVAGLNQTFAGEPFGPMPYLMALADEVVTLSAVCMKCKRIGAATRTQRLIDNKPAPVNSPTIQVGGLESYEARCRDCWEKGT